jgi:CRP-like cAMP-binding protein
MFTKGMDTMSTSIILKQADIFYGVDTSQIEKIASMCKEKNFNLGEMIFEENSTGNELYIIAEGEVEIILDPALVSDQPQQASTPQTVARLHRGQSFGEVALVDQGLRSAAARSATKNTRLLVVPRSELLQLFEEMPELGYRMMRNLAADLAMKLRGTDFQIRDQLLHE